MLKVKTFSFIFLTVAVSSRLVICCTGRCGTVVQSHYEEKYSYFQNPECKPSKLDQGIQCSDIGPSTEIRGGLYASYGLHYVPLASAYYVARFADAMGYQNRCPTNRTFLRELDIITPWSGVHGATALDIGCDFRRQVTRPCTFPNSKWPFLCSGAPGTLQGAYGGRLETLSYISILQGANLRWELFAHCWRAKSPKNPDSVEIATSFNVFNLDPVLTADDRKLIMKELKKRKFNIDPSNIIEFDYTSSRCD